MSLFLTCDEVKVLTGISRAKAGKSREQLQAAALRSMKIPFYINPAGRPIVSRTIIEGGPFTSETVRPTWEPAVSAHG